jgi:hypothetical protein
MDVGPEEPDNSRAPGRAASDIERRARRAEQQGEGRQPSRLSGKAFAEKLVAQRPSIRVLFTSGHPQLKPEGTRRAGEGELAAAPGGPSPAR